MLLDRRCLLLGEEGGRLRQHLVATPHLREEKLDDLVVVFLTRSLGSHVQHLSRGKAALYLHPLTRAVSLRLAQHGRGDSIIHRFPFGLRCLNLLPASLRPANAAVASFRAPRSAADIASTASAVASPRWRTIDSESEFGLSISP